MTTLMIISPINMSRLEARIRLQRNISIRFLKITQLSCLSKWLTKKGSIWHTRK